MGAGNQESARPGVDEHRRAGKARPTDVYFERSGPVAAGSPLTHACK